MNAKHFSRGFLVGLVLLAAFWWASAEAQEFPCDDDSRVLIDALAFARFQRDYHAAAVDYYMRKISMDERDQRQEAVRLEYSGITQALGLACVFERHSTEEDLQEFREALRAWVKEDDR